MFAIVLPPGFRRQNWSPGRNDTDATALLAPASGSRSLTDDELIKLSRALSFLKLHNGSQCGYDKPVVTLDLETSAGKASYTDSFYACRTHPGEIFVDNIEELENVIGVLLK